MSSHHFPLTHGTLAHCALPIDLTFLFLPMMPFKNGKKIQLLQAFYEAQDNFCFPVIQTLKRNRRSFKSEGGFRVGFERPPI